MKLKIDLYDLMSLGPNIWVFAITGGPCSGKTTGLAYLVRRLSDRGYKVLVVPEVATKLISGGIIPWEKGISAIEFQQGVLMDTLCQEHSFMAAAVAYRNAGYKVVILCDRGTMDGAAYIPADEFAAMLELNGFTLSQLCEQRYHAAMHLRTAADGAEEFYTLANNATRTETPEQARIIDQRTLEAWMSHPHPRVIDNSTDFEGKLHRLFAEICGVIGDPVPLEKERKFLIAPVDPLVIPVKTHSSDITQDYLVSPAKGEERRVRARGGADGWTYFYTQKRPVSPGVRVEREQIVSQSEYRTLLTMRDPAARTIKKRRVTFFWKSQYFEVDVFSEPRMGLYLMEAEQTDQSGELILPPFITVIREVTGDPAYSNKWIAREVQSE